MLVSNTLRYALARGISGLLNFAALVVFTRLLGKEGYGAYALVLASVGLAYATLYQWLSLATLRLLHGNLAPRDAFLAAVRRAFLKVTVAVAGVAGVMLAFGGPALPAQTILLGCVLLVVQSWFELNLMIQSADGRPLTYGVLAASRSLVCLVAGGGLALAGYGATGVLAGAALGFLLPGLVQAGRAWPAARATREAPAIERALVRYGAPLVATYMLDFVVSSSDRLLIGGILGTAAAGSYAAAYDLTQQALWTLLMVVNLAAYPVAVAAKERDDPVAFDQACRRHLTVLLALAMPATIGLVLLSGPIGRVVLGAEVGADAGRLIPVIAVAVFLGGIKAFYFDLSFQLGRSTLHQLWVALATAALNLLLNLLWIPRLGGRGAALATLCAYAGGLTLSVMFGRRVLSLPIPFRAAGRLLLAGAVMGAVVWPLREVRSAWGLAAVSLAGAAVYGIMILAANPLGVRGAVAARIGWRT